VLNVFSSETANYPDRADVFYVDIGQTFAMPIAELYELPPHLAKIPYQVSVVQGLDLFISVSVCLSECLCVFL